MGDYDDSPGSDDGPSTSNGGPKGGGPLSWSGKPKTTGQLAGEALASTIVESVRDCLFWNIKIYTCNNFFNSISSVKISVIQFYGYFCMKI